ARGESDGLRSRARSESDERRRPPRDQQRHIVPSYWTSRQSLAFAPPATCARRPAAHWVHAGPLAATCSPARCRGLEQEAPGRGLKTGHLTDSKKAAMLG